MRVKCLAQEHNTMSLARAQTRTALSGVERTNHEATAPPTITIGQNAPQNLRKLNMRIRVNYFIELRGQNKTKEFLFLYYKG